MGDSGSGWWARFVAFWHRSPEPRHPTFRWALHATTAFFRKRTYLIGLLLLPVAAGFAGAAGAPQASNGKNPSGLDRGVAAVLAYLVALVGLIVVVYLVCLVIAPYRQKRDLLSAAKADELPNTAPIDPRRKQQDRLNDLYAKGYKIFEDFEGHEESIMRDRTTNMGKSNPPDGITWDQWHERVALDLQFWMKVSESQIRDALGEGGIAMMQDYRDTTSTYKKTPYFIPEKNQELWRSAFYRLDWLESIGAGRPLPFENHD